jgi:hypothetical protein
MLQVNVPELNTAPPMLWALFCSNDVLLMLSVPIKSGGPVLKIAPPLYPTKFEMNVEYLILIAPPLL